MKHRIFRRLMMLLLAVMVSMTMLTGCGDDDDDDDRKKTEDTKEPGGQGNSTVNPTGTEPTKEQTEPTKEPTAEPTAEPVPTDTPTPVPTETPTPIPTNSPTPIPTVAPAAALESGKLLYLAIPDSNLNKVVTTLPTAVSVVESTLEGRNIHMTSDSAKIKKLVEAFAQVKVGEYLGNTSQTTLNSIVFKWQDGSETAIYLLGTQLVYNTGATMQMYNCTGMEELVKVAVTLSEGGDGPEDLVEVVCKEQNFKTKTEAGMPVLYDEDAGLYIGTDPEDAANLIPYALIYRWGNIGVSAENYLTEYFTPIMQRDYGSSLLEVTKVESFDVQFADGVTRTLYGAAYRYNNTAGNTLWLYRLVGDFNGEIVTFSAKFIDGEEWSENAAMAALEIGTVYFEMTDKKGGNGNDPKEDPKDDPKVTADPNSVTYTKYDNGLIAMDIPTGWVVEVHDKADYKHYTLQVYDPKNPDLRLFYNIKYECFASKEDHDIYTSVYPKGELADLMWVDEYTPEAFFDALYKSEKDTGVFKWRRTSNFKRIEVAGKEAVLGGDIVRATSVNAEGGKVEGLYSAYFQRVSLYYLYMLTVYQNYAITAPEGYLDAWTPVFTKIYSSMEFSEEMQKKLKEE